jgi:hypothetical protein
LWIERRHRPGTLNELLGVVVPIRRTEIREWRAWAKEETSGLPGFRVPVTITVQEFRARGIADALACALAAKGAIDGVVDSGVLADDGPRWVHAITFVAPQRVGYDGMRLVFRPVEEHATRPQPGTGQISLLAEQDPA